MTGKRILAAVCLALLLSGCAGNAADAPAFSPQTAEYSFPLPGLSRPYRLLFVCDLHLIAENDPQVNEKDRAESEQRRTQMFGNSYGDSAAYWAKLAPVLDSYGADLIVFAGDMLDYASEATVALLADGLAQIETPYLYLRADHDTEPFYTDETLDRADTYALQDAVADNSTLLFHDLGEIRVVGWNYSTEQMPAMLAEALGALATDSGADTPVIFVTHVPLAPLSDTSLSEASRRVFNDRSLLWGTDCYYVPDPVTAQGLQTVYDGTLPVRHVFAGHLHFRHDGMLTESCEQHVLLPAFGDAVSVVTFTPEKP